MGVVLPIQHRTRATVTIADGQSLSSASAAMAGRTLVGVVTPSGWTTASISFQVSHDDGTTYNVLLDSTGAEVTAASVVASRYVAVDATLFLGVTHIKVQSGTSGSVTAQSGGDVVTLVLLGPSV